MLTNRLLSGLMALMLLVTTGAAAHARHGALGQLITICAGPDLIEIRVGADGQPIGAAPHCPECITQLAMPLSSPSASSPDSAARSLVQVLGSTPRWTTRVHRAVARAPPVSV